MAAFSPTLTVVVTDVVGSTALLERLGHDGWRRALTEHEKLMIERLGAYGGERLKAMGDGHILTFRSARAALRFAVELQRALGQSSDLSVRIGLHTGEPEEQDGDLAGRSMVKAARLGDLARGGEILASSVVAELAGGDGEIGDDVWFDDTREVELRGLRGQHGIVTVRWDDETGRGVSVVVADDAAVIRDGVAAVLREAGIEVLATAKDAEALLAAVDRHRPDVVVTDIRMPPTYTDEGLVAAERIAESHPAIGVLVLSQHLEPGYAVQLVREHAARRGYLLKDRVSDIDVLVDAVRRVARGGSVVDPAIAEQLVDRAASSGPLEELTEREREVLGCIAEGLSNRSIAERLVVTLKTVETHVGQIFLKLGLREETSEHRRVAAVLTYLRATAEN